LPPATWRPARSIFDEEIGRPWQRARGDLLVLRRRYETPAAALTPPDRAWVLGVASYGLRAQGRLQEALSAMRTSLRMAEETQDWGNAAIHASNLSETELLFGEVAAGVTTAEHSVALADRTNNASEMMADA
jgi:hypothetical protein